MAAESVTLSGPALRGVLPLPLMSLVPGATAPQTVRLGRLRPKARPMALALSEYLEVEKAAIALPTSVDYTAKALSSLARMYLNDQYGDCVIAGKYHAVGVWSGNDAGTPVVGTDQEVLSAYHTICGPGDNGCVITDVLDWMRTRGLSFAGKAHKIDGYVQCDWRNADLVKAAVYLFGCLTIGVNLPEAWTSAAVWDVTGSRIVGGHDVTCVGYTSQGVQISSWGRVYTITWPAFTSTRWLEECYALLGPDWYNDDRLAPCGVDVTALLADLQKVGGGQVPPIEPVPPPPPGPTPPTPPPPTPTPPAKLFSLTFSRAVPQGGRVSFRTPVAIPPGKYDVVPSQGTGTADEEAHSPEVEP